VAALGGRLGGRMAFAREKKNKNRISTCLTDLVFWEYLLTCSMKNMELTLNSTFSGSRVSEAKCVWLNKLN
jgi:hypothetical protein